MDWARPTCPEIAFLPCFGAFKPRLFHTLSNISIVNDNGQHFMDKQEADKWSHLLLFGMRLRAVLEAGCVGVYPLEHDALPMPQVNLWEVPQGDSATARRLASIARLRFINLFTTASFLLFYRFDMGLPSSSPSSWQARRLRRPCPCPCA